MGLRLVLVKTRKVVKDLLPNESNLLQASHIEFQP